MRLAAEAPAPWLEAGGLTKVYGGVVALRDTSVELRRGEIVAVGSSKIIRRARNENARATITSRWWISGRSPTI